MESLGRLIVGIGVVLLVAGGLLVLLGRLGVPSLPGDISLRRGNLHVFIPIGTSILVSVILTVMLNVLIRR